MSWRWQRIEESEPHSVQHKWFAKRGRNRYPAPKELKSELTAGEMIENLKIARAAIEKTSP